MVYSYKLHRPCFHGKTLSFSQLCPDIRRHQASPAWLTCPRCSNFWEAHLQVLLDSSLTHHFMTTFPLESPCKINPCSSSCFLFPNLFHSYHDIGCSVNSIKQGFAKPQALQNMLEHNELNDLQGLPLLFAWEALFQRRDLKGSTEREHGDVAKYNHGKLKQFLGFRFFSMWFKPKQTYTQLVFTE